MSWDFFILRQQSIPWGTLLSSITAQLRELFRDCRLPDLTLRDLSTQKPVASPQHALGDETAYLLVVLDSETSIGISYDRVNRSPRSPDWFVASLGGSRTDAEIVLGVIAACEICRLGGNGIDDNGLIDDLEWATTEEFRNALVKGRGREFVDRARIELQQRYAVG